MAAQTKQRRALQGCLLLLPPPALALLFPWYYHIYTDWDSAVYPFTLAVFAVMCLLLTTLTSVPRSGGRIVWKKAIFRALLSVVLLVGVEVIAVSFLINNVLRLGSRLAALVSLGLALAHFLVLFIFALRAHGSRIWRRGGALFLGLCILFSGGLGFVMPFYYKNTFKAPAPAGYRAPLPVKLSPLPADYYVCVTGSDKNDGSLEKPFATIEKARDTLRKLDKTGRKDLQVALLAGEYFVTGLTFTAADSGTIDCPVTYRAYGNGEVILNGGITLDPADFSLRQNPEYDRADGTHIGLIFDRAADNLALPFIELTALGLTAEDWGALNAIGSYNQAHQYDDGKAGSIHCELFYNDRRMTLARYPNGGEFLKTGKILRETYHDLPGSTQEIRRNAAGDVFRPDKKTAARLAKYIASGISLEDIWLMGYWKYDWADAAAPIAGYDPAENALAVKYASSYGIKKGAPYYIYNSFSELDAPGEWYLDRKTGTLFLYPCDDSFEDAKITLSLTTQPVIQAQRANYLRFEGLTIQGTRGNALELTGDHNTVTRCLIKNVAGWAMLLKGSENLADGNEITRTGQGGIKIEGGDRETLTAGNSAAVNNWIHDWSEIYLTYQPAVELQGVGNRCQNNEIYNSPHEAITFFGNDHLIADNLIHDVCLLSDDAGAIYSGRRWDNYGSVIRGNVIYNLGSGAHKPNGIYLDDALSGVSVVNNLLVNVPGTALAIGGGRDLRIEKNILVNAGTPIYYDARAREGAIGEAWFSNHSAKGGGMWLLLFESPWQTETWKKAYPQMQKFSSDFSQPDSPDFVPNPAYSTVRFNYVLGSGTKLGNIQESVYRFSTVEHNSVTALARGSPNGLFADAAAGDYSIVREKASRLHSTPAENLPQNPMEGVGRK